MFGGNEMGKLQLGGLSPINQSQFLLGTNAASLSTLTVDCAMENVS